VLAGRLGHVPRWRGTLGLFPRADRVLALRAIERVGLIQQAHQRASTLSGGQQQRGAIARALTQQARLILADEPIASLDPRNAAKVMDALAAINREEGLTVLCNLHTLDTARHYCNRIVGMAAGEVVFDGAPERLTKAVVQRIYGTAGSQEESGEEIAEAITSTSLPAFEDGRRRAAAQMALTA